MTVKKGKHQTFTRNALFVNLLLSENILFCVLSKVHWFTIFFSRQGYQQNKTVKQKSKVRLVGKEK